MYSISSYYLAHEHRIVSIDQSKSRRVVFTKLENRSVVHYTHFSEMAARPRKRPIDSESSGENEEIKALLKWKSW